MILVFSVKLQWLPASGYGEAKQLVMPVIVMASGMGASVTRLTRSSMLDVMTLQTFFTQLPPCFCKISSGQSACSRYPPRSLSRRRSAQTPVLGLLAGYFGGWVDAVISRMIDVMLSFPFIFLAMLLVAVLGSSLVNVILVLGITGWVPYGSQSPTKLMERHPTSSATPGITVSQPAVKI